jgi:hypothetical protein
MSDQDLPHGSVEKVPQQGSLPSPERLHVYALKRFDAQARRQVAPSA